MESIAIYTSKKRATLLLMGSIVFVLLGAWLFMEAEDLSTLRSKNPAFIRIVGIATMLFFGFGVFFTLKLLTKSKKVLLIAPSGLCLFPNSLPIEFIKWNDIQGFEEISIVDIRTLIVRVDDHDHWLEKETNLLRKQTMQRNILHYGSPFIINVLGLDISAEELYELLYNYQLTYKNNRS